jgi:hypothetical protein
MANGSNRGVPPLGPALIRPTPPEQPEAPEPAEAIDDAGQGGSPQADARAASTRGRKRRADKPQAATGKRGLYLTPATWQRLQLEAIRKGTTVSAVAEDVLVRNLPRLRIERD